MIMIHGRGADAESILSLANEFPDKQGFIFAAPQADNNTWYPYSFLAPVEMNQPFLDSGLNSIKNLVNYFEEKKITSDKIILLGFSQGACLALEFSARNSKKYGGLIALSGGLIGDKLDLQNYKGDFLQTPVFLGCADNDPHIPIERVNESAGVFDSLNAKVIKRIYPGMGHNINNDEILFISEIMKNFKTFP